MKAKSPQTVILINGPSSSGKSTLARALQARIEAQDHVIFPIVSIDDYLRMTLEEPIYEDDVYAISQELNDAVCEKLSTASGVIVDHAITSERIYTRCIDALAPYRLFTVRVVCPTEVLRRREATRKNRYRGSAEASLQYLFPKSGYDLTVDTHRMTAEECAEEIYHTFFTRKG